jgi:putative FmdB family regulatory protein
MRSFGSTLDDETVASRLGLNGVNAMPRYEFLCEKCKKPFELIMTIAEREKPKPECPICKDTKVFPQVQRLHGADGEEELNAIFTRLKWNRARAI